MDLLTCAYLRSEARLASPPQEYVLYRCVTFCYNWRQRNHVFFRDRYLSNENRLITVFNSKQSRLFFRLIGFGKLLGLVAFLITACQASQREILNWPSCVTFALHVGRRNFFYFALELTTLPYIAATCQAKILILYVSRKDQCSALPTDKQHARSFMQLMPCFLRRKCWVVLCVKAALQAKK